MLAGQRNDERSWLRRFVESRSASFWTTAVVVLFAVTLTYGAPPDEDTEGSLVLFAIAMGILFGLPCYGLGRLIRYVRKRLEPREVVAGMDTMRARPEYLSIRDLHPWVADSVHEQWAKGFHQDAVASAAKAVNAATQQKLRRYDLNETRLFQDAYSQHRPESGKPRLRFLGDPNTSSWKSRMSAAPALAQACFSGVRNVVSHEHGVEWSAEEAFEYLASFSALARWIDRCEVYRVD